MNTNYHNNPVLQFKITHEPDENFHYVVTVIDEYRGGMWHAHYATMEQALDYIKLEIKHFKLQHRSEIDEM